MKRDKAECPRPMQGQDCAPMRMTAKAVLLEKAEKLRAEAHRIECLARELPDHLSPQADETLWNMAIRG